MSGHGFDITGQLELTRRFEIHKRRRWTLVAEYLSNGQQTAAWFQDNETGSWYLAESWKRPNLGRPLNAEQSAFVESLTSRHAPPFANVEALQAFLYEHRHGPGFIADHDGIHAATVQQGTFRGYEARTDKGAWRYHLDGRIVPVENDNPNGETDAPEGCLPQH